MAGVAPDREVAERRGAVVVRALAPVWVVPFGLVSWAWLVAAFGGQDVGALGWWVAICEAVSPWGAHDGVRGGALAVYALALAGPLGLTGVMAAGAPPHLRAHARRALVDWGLMAWLLVATPYAMGLVAGLPVDGISLVAGGEVVGGSAAGNRARVGSAVVFPGLLMALPVVMGWRRALAAAGRGAAPTGLSRRQWVFHGVVALVGVAIVASAVWAPL